MVKRQAYSLTERQAELGDKSENLRQTNRGQTIQTRALKQAGRQNTKKVSIVKNGYNKTTQHHPLSGGEKTEVARIY